MCNKSCDTPVTVVNVGLVLTLFSHMSRKQEYFIVIIINGWMFYFTKSIYHLYTCLVHVLHHRAEYFIQTTASSQYTILVLHVKNVKVFHHYCPTWLHVCTFTWVNLALRFFFDSSNFHTDPLTLCLTKMFLK